MFVKLMTLLPSPEMPSWTETSRLEVWQVVSEAEVALGAEVAPEPPLVLLLSLVAPPWPDAALGTDVAPEVLEANVAPEAVGDVVRPEAVEPAGSHAVRDSPAARTTRARTESLLL